MRKRSTRMGMENAESLPVMKPSQIRAEERAAHESPNLSRTPSPVCRLVVFGGVDHF